MNKYVLPASGIIIVTVILVSVNQFTESTIVKDYALVFIIAGMFAGIGLTKMGEKSEKDKS